MIRKRYFALPLWVRIVLSPFLLVLAFVLVIPFAIVFISAMLVVGEDATCDFLEQL